MSTVCVSIHPENGKITDEQIAAMQEISDAMAEHTNEQVRKVMEEEYPGIPFNGALDIVYLRTRSRHTPGLEKELADIYMSGGSVNICDWPPRPSQK